MTQQRMDFEREEKPYSRYSEQKLHPPLHSHVLLNEAITLFSYLGLLSFVLFFVLVTIPDVTLQETLPGLTPNKIGQLFFWITLLILLLLYILLLVRRIIRKNS